MLLCSSGAVPPYRRCADAAAAAAGVVASPHSPSGCIRDHHLRLAGADGWKERMKRRKEERKRRWDPCGFCCPVSRPSLSSSHAITRSSTVGHPRSNPLRAPRTSRSWFAQKKHAFLVDLSALIWVAGGGDWPVTLRKAPPPSLSASKVAVACRRPSHSTRATPLCKCLLLILPPTAHPSSSTLLQLHPEAARVFAFSLHADQAEDVQRDPTGILFANGFAQSRSYPTLKQGASFGLTCWFQ